MTRSLQRTYRGSYVRLLLALTLCAALLGGAYRVTALGPELLQQPLSLPFHKQPHHPIQQILVKLAPGVSPTQFAARFNRSTKIALLNAHAIADGQTPLRFCHCNKVLGWTTYRLPSPSALNATLQLLRKQPGVLRAEPDYPVELCNTPLPDPNDYYWKRVDLEHLIVVLSGLDTPDTARQDDSSYWTYTWNLETVNALAAWNIYPGHYETAQERAQLYRNNPLSPALPRVAVIDSGIDFTHPDFTYTGNPSGGVTDADITNGGQIDEALAHTFIDGDQGGGVTNAFDDVGHGTSLAGIIAAAPNNGLGIPGLAFPAVIVPIKIIDANGDGSDSDLIDAIQYAADQHCIAINLSLTLDTTDFPQALQDAINYAWNHGCLCVAAAGNDGDPSYPILARTRRYPACCDHVLAVAATAYGDPIGPDGLPNTVLDEHLASYSNDGYELGCAAPGGDITEFYNNSPNGADLGLNPIQEYVLVWSLAPTYQVLLSNPDPNNPDGLYAALGLYGLNYGYLPGTSLACPHVAALAALLAARLCITPFTQNAPQILVNTIARGCHQLNNRRDGGYDPTYGYGRIDAAATLALHNARGTNVGGIMGQVTVDGTPLGNIPVIARTAGSKRVFYTTTAPDGMYHLINLPQGNYTVTAIAFRHGRTVRAKVVAGCDQLGVDLDINIPFAF